MHYIALVIGLSSAVQLLQFDELLCSALKLAIIAVYDTGSPVWTQCSCAL